jgi:hypothetical protein
LPRLDHPARDTDFRGKLSKLVTVQSLPLHMEESDWAIECLLWPNVVDSSSDQGVGS